VPGLELKTNDKKLAISLSIMVQTLFSDHLGEMINSEWQNPTGFSKQVFQSFYTRVHNFYQQYQELATSEKVSATLSKIYATAVSKKKEKCFMIEEHLHYGSFHPKINLSDFTTPFDSLSVTQIFYHLLGSEIYLKNIKEVFITLKTQRVLYTENWDFSDFITEYVLDSRFESFLTALTRQPQQTVEQLLNAISRYIQRHHKFPDM